MEKWFSVEKDGLPKDIDYRNYIVFYYVTDGYGVMSFAQYDPYVSSDPEVVWISDRDGYVKATHWMFAPERP